MYARGLTAIVCFLLIFCSISGVNIILDGIISGIIRRALLDPGSVSAAEITEQIHHARFITRSINIVIYAVLMYFLLGLTLRPIKGVMDSQKRFIADISHELRTPLAVAKTEIEVALRRPDQLSHEESRAILASTLERIDQMSHTLQFFLMLSDFNTRNRYAANQPVSLPERIQTVLDTVSEMARKARVRVLLDIREEAHLQQGNPVALEKMILNLVRNAIAYSHPGSTVTISLEQVSGKTVLSVRDTGVGISETDQARIFKPFIRGANAKPEGMGVGLSIVREVARIHGAKVTVQSQVGQGSTFRVIFNKTL